MYILYIIYTNLSFLSFFFFFPSSCLLFAGPFRWPPRQASDSHSERCPLRGHAKPFGFHVSRRGERRPGQADRLPESRGISEDKGPDRGERGQVRLAQHHLLAAWQSEHSTPTAAESTQNKPNRAPPPRVPEEDAPHVEPSAPRLGLIRAKEEEGKAEEAERLVRHTDQRALRPGAAVLLGG